MARELTPEEQARRDHWAKVHIEADKRPPRDFADQPRFRGFGRFSGWCRGKGVADRVR